MRIVFTWGSKIPYDDWIHNQDGMIYCYNELGRDHEVIILNKADVSSVLNREHFKIHFLKTEKDILKLINSSNPDIIVMNPIVSNLNYMIISKFDDITKLAYYHGGVLFDVGVYLLCKKLIVQTSTQKRMIAECDPGRIDPEKIEVIPYGVDRTVFKPLNIKKEYTCIYQATLALIKRNDLACEAMRHINGNLLLFGREYDQSVVNNCNRLIQELKNIDRKGWVPFLQVPKILNKAAIGLLVGIEGGTRAIAELMSCGLPIVTCLDSRSTCTIVRESGGGIIVNPTPKSIAIGIKEVLTLYPSFKHNALKYIKKELTVELMYKRMKTLIEQVSKK